MISAIALDTGPLGLVTKRRGVPEAEACRRWIRHCIQSRLTILVPSFAYYEVRRELERANQEAGLRRLELFCEADPRRYLPLRDEGLRLACRLWALARQNGTPTADPKELDCDALIAAQALDYQNHRYAAKDEIIVATGNVGHLSLFVPAELWTNILPES